MEPSRPQSTPSTEDRLARLEAKVDQLLEVQNKQNRALFPPIWKRLLLWMAAHWVVLTAIGLLGYFIYEIYSIVEALDGQIQNLKDTITGLWQKAQFWK